MSFITLKTLTANLMEVAQFGLFSLLSTRVSTEEQPKGTDFTMRKPGFKPWPCHLNIQEPSTQESLSSEIERKSFI